MFQTLSVFNVLILLASSFTSELSSTEQFVTTDAENMNISSIFTVTDPSTIGKADISEEKSFCTDTACKGFIFGTIATSLLLICVFCLISAHDEERSLGSIFLWCCSKCTSSNQHQQQERMLPARQAPGTANIPV